MTLQDPLQSPRISRLTRLMQDLRESQSPEQTLNAIQLGFGEDGESVASLLISTRGMGHDQYRITNMHLRDDPSENGATAGSRNPAAVHTGGLVPKILSREAPQLIQDVDWSRDPEFRDVLRLYSSVIAVPFSSHRLPMNWALLLKQWPGRFSLADLEVAVERVALGGALLENQMLAAELARAYEQIDREARQVGQLQRALLPASVPRIAGLDIATSYQPTGRAGGDLFDFLPLDDGRWCILIGDASGHGLAAAVVMAIVQAVLHAHPDRVAGPATLLIHANRQLCAKQIGGFFTAFLGVYEPASRRLTYVNAGHPPPLLKRADNSSVLALDDVLSFPLGIDDAETFEEAMIELHRGDTVVLYTDGITEMRNAEGELFSQDRLTRALGARGNGPVDVIEWLRAAVRAHQSDTPAADDQTLVAARAL